jgi:hypothetical protein
MPTPALPWRFAYQKDRPRQREVLRPIVSARLRGPDLSSPVVALVDSGCEHVLAAPWLANDTAVDLSHPTYETTLGIGGDEAPIRFVEMNVRLQHPGGEDDHYIEWETEVGFPTYWRAPWPMLLGQHGFFDRFTVSMHRSARLTVVESWSTFDDRFGVDVESDSEQGPTRFDS